MQVYQQPLGSLGVKEAGYITRYSSHELQDKQVCVRSLRDLNSRFMHGTHVVGDAQSLA